MLEKIISEEPASGRAHYALGDVQHKAGNLKAALAAYQRCNELDPEDHNAVRNLQWIKERLEIIKNPITVPASVLASYEGQYDVRKVTFRDGKLYYQREGNAENLLIPVSQDTFALEKSDTFRLRFLQENDGAIRKIIGIYIDGRTDESLRNDF
jgi:tetratricopeptide (TPR) repeat protein